jgi:transposase-like protein
MAEKLEGPDEAKRRLKAILETISGTKTIEDAASEIGVGAARFHELRKEVLQAALVALEPKPAGRPRTTEEPNPRVAELENQIRELTIEINASKVREQIALTMPRLLKTESDPTAEPDALKKTKKSKVLDKIQGERHRHHR